MDKSKLAPSIIIAVGLIVSSLTLSYSMNKLGEDVVAAGIHSRNVSLSHTNNGSPLRIKLDDDSVVQPKTNQKSDTMRTTSTMIFGIRNSSHQRAEFFGLDEIQRALDTGAVITSLDSGGIIYTQVEGYEGDVKAFGGGSFSAQMNENPNISMHRNR
jgi:hypothetical protein